MAAEVRPFLMFAAHDLHLVVLLGLLRPPAETLLLVPNKTVHVKVSGDRGASSVSTCAAAAAAATTRAHSVYHHLTIGKLLLLLLLLYLLLLTESEEI